MTSFILLRFLKKLRFISFQNGTHSTKIPHRLDVKHILYIYRDISFQNRYHTKSRVYMWWFVFIPNTIVLCNHKSNAVVSPSYDAMTTTCCSIGGIGMFHPNQDTSFGPHLEDDDTRVTIADTTNGASYYVYKIWISIWDKYMSTWVTPNVRWPKWGRM